MVVVKTSFVMNVFVLKHVCVFVQIHRRTGDSLCCCQIRKNWGYKGVVLYGIQCTCKEHS